MVVEDAEEGVVGDETQSHMAQQSVCVGVAMLEVVGDPPVVDSHLMSTSVKQTEEESQREDERER